MRMSDTIKASVPLGVPPVRWLFTLHHAEPLLSMLSEPHQLCLAGSASKWKSSVEEGTATLKELQGVDVQDSVREKAREVLKQMNELQDSRSVRGKKAHLSGKMVWQRLHSASVTGKLEACPL